jgi:parallel beta-helix repeat protein
LTITENSTFNNSSVYARNANDPEKLVWIKDCNFQGGPIGSTQITIDDYYNFYVNNCTIVSPQGSAGIAVMNSGDLGTRYNDISECDIENITGENCEDETGIWLYNSRANIKNNNLHNNCYGIKMLNRSNASIEGTPLFPSEESTQRIKNNHIAQVYITEDAFPSKFEWNTVYDSYFWTWFIYNTDPRPPFMDVENNFWGLNYDPNTNLYPYGFYDYTPTYTPPNKELNIVEAM